MSKDDEYDESRSVSSDSEFEKADNSEEFSDYKLDGYHPVFLSENFNNSKYCVIQKLGWGHFSTVWLVNEKKTNNYYALKIQKSKKSYFEAAMDELSILKELNKNEENPEWTSFISENNELHNLKFEKKDNFVIKLIDDFIHFGMHGKHPCLLMEVMGPNLLDLIQHFEFKDLEMDLKLVKLITIQILLGLDYMHRICNVIHTDLKPENIMIELNHFELDDFVKKLQQYKKKPLSMKFLKYLKNKLGQTSNKNKKKYQKKKEKKKALNEAKGSLVSEFNGLKIINQCESNPVPLSPLIDNLNNDYNEKIDIISDENSAKIPQNDNKTELLEEKKDKIEENKYDPKILRWKDNILIPLDDHLRIKIVDFGNACWVNKHFTDNIQTREYRSPEAILGQDYGTSTDIWSLACIVFEMITNTFLFKPKKGDDYSKNDDHLALMIETLGKFPKNLTLIGKKSRNFFNKNGHLIRIKNIKEYRIKDILINDFKINEVEAENIQEFLLPMLEYDPKKRIDAKTALKSKWLWT